MMKQFHCNCYLPLLEVLDAQAVERTPCWKSSASSAVGFTKHAHCSLHCIRSNMKNLPRS